MVVTIEAIFDTPDRLRNIPNIRIARQRDKRSIDPSTLRDAHAPRSVIGMFIRGSSIVMRGRGRGRVIFVAGWVQLRADSFGDWDCASGEEKENCQTLYWNDRLATSVEEHGKGATNRGGEEKISDVFHRSR